jgi:uncharacterized protein YggT (Ycf19 family)
MVAVVLVNLIQIYMVMILLRALATWLQLDMRKTPVQLLCRATDPFLAQIRRIVPPLGGAIDISPVVAMLALAVLAAILKGVL